MKKFGVTQKALGVTPHGLQHEYAGERYEAVAGAAPPVRGGARPVKPTSAHACTSPQSSGTRGCRLPPRFSGAHVRIALRLSRKTQASRQTGAAR